MKLANKNELKQFINRYRHGIILVYFFFYMIWFTYLERTVTKFTPVYSKLDKYIPFMEIFVIPYLLWFGYIFATVAYFFFTSKKDYYKCCAYLFIGMTICLTIYTIWPNGHYLRVNLNTLGRDNIFIKIVRFLYTVDTSTNVCPSIHVYNSIGAMIAIRKSERLRNIKWLQISAFILTILICMSTVFLKQHSVMDVLSATVLSLIMYIIVYVPAWNIKSKEADRQLSKI